MRFATFAALAVVTLPTIACNNTAKPQAAATVSDTAAPPQALAGASPAGAAGIPDGHYGCLFGGGGSPGYVDIRGATYRGPSLDGSGAFAPYTIDAAGGVTWSAGFGAFSVASTQYRGISNDASHSPWFTVTYNRTSGGGVDAIDCEREA